MIVLPAVRVRDYLCAWGTIIVLVLVCALAWFCLYELVRLLVYLARALA